VSSVALETYLARLYTDKAARERFNADPTGEALRAGLSAAECAALESCDRVGLQMAAESFGHKRAQHAKHRVPFYRRALNRLLRR
jgi:hypothetical protein